MYALLQGPSLPKLKLIILAGYGLIGTPLTGKPADHRIASRISESYPPHFPNTRTGRIQDSQVVPAIPMLLLVAAPINPDTRVPCQELFSIVHFEKKGCCWSLLSIQSPGSVGSPSRPSPSFAVRNELPPELPSAAMKSYPGSSLPAWAARPRSGWSKRTPVSSTATTVPVLPVVVSQANSAPIAAA